MWWKFNLFEHSRKNSRPAPLRVKIIKKYFKCQFAWKFYLLKDFWVSRQVVCKRKQKSIKWKGENYIHHLIVWEERIMESAGVKLLGSPHFFKAVAIHSSTWLRLNCAYQDFYTLCSQNILLKVSLLNKRPNLLQTWESSKLILSKGH